MSNYIRDVYCYCDHFCDDCPLTQRCAVFAGSQALKDSDPESPGFWQELMERFVATHEHLTDIPEFNVEVRRPTDEELEEARSNQEELDRQLADEVPYQAAKRYLDEVMALLEDSGYWRAKARATATQAAMGLRNAKEAMREANLVTNLLYRLRRFAEVCELRVAEAIRQEATAIPQSTSPHGLAKAALLCTEKSHVSLRKLYAIFADEDRILPFFAFLGELERAVEARFPDARSFRRPGFDEPALRATG